MRVRSPRRRSAPTARRVLTGSFDATARFWEVPTGRPIGSPLKHENTVFSVAYSPDGKTVMTGSWDQTAQLWDASTGKPIGPSAATSRMGLGRGLQSGRQDGDHRELGRHGAGSGMSRPASPTAQPLAHKSLVSAVAFAPDGKTVATASFDSTARIWDAANGQPVGTPLQHRHAVLTLAFSPDGKTILTGDIDNLARRWSTTTFQEIGQPLAA